MGGRDAAGVKSAGEREGKMMGGAECVGRGADGGTCRSRSGGRRPPEPGPAPATQQARRPPTPARVHAFVGRRVGGVHLTLPSSS